MSKPDTLDAIAREKHLAVLRDFRAVEYVYMCSADVDRHEYAAKVEALDYAITALSNQGEGAVAVYGMRRKGETAIIGVIPAKVHQNPANSKDYLRDYEEVPLYLQPAEADRRDAERWQWARKMENREAAANYFAARMNVDAAVDAAIAATQENGK